MNKQAEELKKLIDEINDLLTLHWKSPELTVWINKIERFFKKNFGEESDYYKQFHHSAYDGLVVVSSSMTDNDFQRDRNENLNKYRILLKSFLDELKDSPEQNIPQTQQSTNQNQSNDKLFELQQKIEEAKMEAERRKAVVEAKVYGAEIEIITELRNELKRKDETRKEITEIKLRLDSIEQKISENMRAKSVTSEFEEDKLYAEIMVLSSMRDKDTLILDLITNARSELVEIKALRDEIKMLQQQIHIPSRNLFEKDNIMAKISAKSGRITELLKSLAETWGSFQ